MRNGAGDTLSQANSKLNGQDQQHLSMRATFGGKGDDGISVSGNHNHRNNRYHKVSQSLGNDTTS